MTQQKFYRVNGGSTQLKGVSSDIVLPDTYAYIETGEAENEYVMPWDKIPAAKYKKWQADFDINEVIRNSNSRIKSNSSFQLIDKTAKEMKTQRDITSFSLNYKQHKKEERILMFLDLKDSTTIAEKIGHKLYSKFIQNCFSDLDRILHTYEAEIYQYVGDEAVISWTTKKGFNKNNCVNLFFAFQNVLKSKSIHYNKKYNYVPEFKAGIHCGKLIIAEVGTIKKEIAYHGDVINTTARIQSLCNSYNSPLLVSEFLLQKLTIKLNYIPNLIGDISLKGKEEKLGHT